MDALELILGAVTGVFGGAVGGVLTAGQISQRAELARERLDAQRTLREVIRRYRATIVFDHDQVYEVSHFSTDYSSITGQEEFAAAILSNVGALRRRPQLVLRAELLRLVGDLRFRLAAQRTWLPPERLDPERESKRQSLALHQIIHSGEERVDGLLPSILGSQNEPERHSELYRQALAALDVMLAAVGDERHPATGRKWPVRRPPVVRRDGGRRMRG